MATTTLQSARHSGTLKTFLLNKTCFLRKHTQPLWVDDRIADLRIAPKDSFWTLNWTGEWAGILLGNRLLSCCLTQPRPETLHSFRSLKWLGSTFSWNYKMQRTGIRTSGIYPQIRFTVCPRTTHLPAVPALPLVNCRQYWPTSQGVGRISVCKAR